jgi:hypothetical protein
VVAAEKGIVVGRVIFEDDEDTIDCTKMGIGGKAIPPSIDRVTGVRGDAQFILLIEKDAAFMRLAEDRRTAPACLMWRDWQAAGDAFAVLRLASSANAGGRVMPPTRCTYIPRPKGSTTMCTHV